MNYYNPYFFNMPSANTGLLSRMFGNIKLSSILSGANKTLNFVNQTIPIIKQIKPMVRNAKTMFSVVNQFKKIDEPKKEAAKSDNLYSNNKTIINKSTINQPNFFI